MGLGIFRLIVESESEKVDRRYRALSEDERDAEQVALVENYAKTTGLWADALEGAEYERVLEFDLSKVDRTMAGPSNPQRRSKPHDTHDILRGLRRAARRRDS